MVKDVSTYVTSTVSAVQEILNSDKMTNGPEGTVASKTVKSIELVEKGLQRLNMNVNEFCPDYEIMPEVCLTLQVENFHAVSHFKHPTCTVLEYAIDFGNTTHESLKCTSQWAAHYFTHPQSYYPVPQNSITLKDVPKMTQLPANKLRCLSATKP